jgi:hypothetical protein
MPHADMAVGIDDILVGENTVGDDEIAEQIVKLAHGGLSILNGSIAGSSGQP